jgi:type VII secretion system ESX-1 substrate
MTDVSHIDWDTARYDDHDLVPGEPYEVAVLGKQLRDTATLIRTQAGNLRNLVDGTGWDSKAGREFQEKVGDAADKLAKAHARYEAAADALGSRIGGDPEADWATALDHAQDLARKALVKGKAAYDESQSYGKSIAQLPKGDSSPAAARMHDQKGLADGALKDAENDLRAALDFRDHHAHKAATAIRDAIDHDGLKDPAHHWWDGPLDLVAKIGHWAGVAAAFLGVAALLLSWVPVLGEVLGALALLASVVALVCDTVSALDGRGTWLDVGIDAIGVLSFGAGRILGTAAKEASAAARASSALKDFQALREVGLNPTAAWDTVEAITGGMDRGATLKALSEAPPKLDLLPGLKATLKDSLNPKLYLDDIRSAVGDIPGFKAAMDPENLLTTIKGIGNPLTRVASSSFKTMAYAGKSIYIASQAVPILAGWSNLAPVSGGETPATGPDLLGDLKRHVPGLGANGIPFYNWRWTTEG